MKPALPSRAAGNGLSRVTLIGEGLAARLDADRVAEVPADEFEGRLDHAGGRIDLALDQLGHRVPLAGRGAEPHVAVGDRAHPVLDQLDPAHLGVVEQVFRTVAEHQDVQAGGLEIALGVQREGGGGRAGSGAWPPGPGRRARRSAIRLAARATAVSDRDRTSMMPPPVLDVSPGSGASLPVSRRSVNALLLPLPLFPLFDPAGRGRAKRARKKRGRHPAMAAPGEVPRAD